MYIDNSQRGSSLLHNHITIRPFFNAFVTPILFFEKNCVIQNNISTFVRKIKLTAFAHTPMSVPLPASTTGNALIYAVLGDGVCNSDDCDPIQ